MNELTIIGFLWQVINFKLGSNIYFDTYIHLSVKFTNSTRARVQISPDIYPEHWHTVCCFTVFRKHSNI